MNKTIIKASGNINEIINTLNFLKRLYGKGATLASIEKTIKENQIKIKK